MQHPLRGPHSLKYRGYHVLGTQHRTNLPCCPVPSHSPAQLFFHLNTHMQLLFILSQGSSVIYADDFH